MKKLSTYLFEQLVLEGGLAGHMRHPIDYIDFTCQDLMDMVRDLFTGKVEHMKEKLDGTNLNAYRNPEGETVFIRNNSDLNSRKGGMTIEELSVKYFDKPSVAENFIRAANTIEEVFSKMPVGFFNPEPGTKVVVNCECITAGKTNVMIYPSDRVAFHGTSTYTRLTDENGHAGDWILASAREGIPSELRRAAEGIKGTEERPDLLVKSVEEGNKIADKFCAELKEIFTYEGLNTHSTIDEWKVERFKKLIPEWLDTNDVYRRWFYGDKKVNLNQLKKKYAENLDDLRLLDSKGYKDIVSKVMEPLDGILFRIGNTLIENLSGFTNSGESANDVVMTLKKDLNDLVRDIQSTGTEDEIGKLDKQLKRLESIGDTLNSAEGVVFIYKGKLMKLTGSFSALNQIMGMRKFSR